MTLEIKHYTRKVLAVEVVEVTTENLKEAAEWCGGEVKTGTRTVRGDNGEVLDRSLSDYVKVPIAKPITVRHTKAFPGDRILKTPQGYKIYPPFAFAATFEEQLVYTEKDAAEQAEVKLSTDEDAVKRIASEDDEVQKLLDEANA